MNGRQLNLISEPATGSIYRAGDWVKVKRKPAVATHIKRGECFEINAVHPRDGSVKIWNPHTNQWDFLYPDEIKLIKSLTPLTAKSVVGEVAKLTAESVVGEVAAQNYWNSDKEYRGNGWLESHYKIRRNGKQHSINCPEIGCTGPYSSYRWMEGKRQRAKYCPASKCPAVRKALKNGKPISKILEIINQ